MGAPGHDWRALGAPLIVILWWLLLSRARWYERLAAVVLIIAAVVREEKYVVHASLAVRVDGLLLSHILVYSVTLSVALVAWAVGEPSRTRRARGAAVAPPSCSDARGSLMRTDGITRDGRLRTTGDGR